MKPIEATTLIAKAFESKKTPGNRRAGLYRENDKLIIREHWRLSIESRLIAVLSYETRRDGPTCQEWDSLTRKVQLEFERKPKCQNKKSSQNT